MDPVFLAGDASFRTYYRLKDSDQSWVLMVAPPEHEKPQDYRNVTSLLEDIGLSVPKIYHTDLAQGYLLLEDFGDQVFSRSLIEGANEKELYERAVDVLIHLQTEPTLHLPLPPYDLEKFLEEVMVFLDWMYPEVTGKKPSSQTKSSFQSVWTKAYHQLPEVPKTLVLRDFMVDNLVWLPDRQGIQSCGLLDFQDAVWGDIAYDVVSLLEDARRDVSPYLVEDMIQRYLRAFPSLDRDIFDHSYYVWGAQRSTKILGIFMRLAKRDQKIKYIDYLPRVWRILRHDFQHPALGEVSDWFDQHKVWGDR